VDLSQPSSQSEIKDMQITKAANLDRASAYILELTLSMETCPRAGMLRDIVRITMQLYEESDSTIPLIFIPLQPRLVSVSSIIEVSSPSAWLFGTTVDFLVESCGTQDEVRLDCAKYMCDTY